MTLTQIPSAVARLPARGSNHPRALFLSSYPPRQCGIATFGEDVRGAYDRLTGLSSDVIAVHEPGSDYAYPACVIGTIDADDPDSYLKAARIANAADIDLVNVQHEYGLYGRDRGAALLEFLRVLRRP